MCDDIAPEWEAADTHGCMRIRIEGDPNVLIGMLGSRESRRTGRARIRWLRNDRDENCERNPVRMRCAPRDHHIPRFADHDAVECVSKRRYIRRAQDFKSAQLKSSLARSLRPPQAKDRVRRHTGPQRLIRRAVFRCKLHQFWFALNADRPHNAGNHHISADSEHKILASAGRSTQRSARANGESARCVDHLRAHRLRKPQLSQTR